MNMTSSSVKASPTKNFFVEMLTRDIALKDAILDLLDNCVDGIQRTIDDAENADTPYKNFWSKIYISDDKFLIEDNCGGIPLEVAARYAFRMGRPKEEIADDDLFTIGTYGIGMKRSIFKLGRSARILSSNERDTFEVTISPSWLESDDDWNLPLNEKSENSLGRSGTLIEVTELREESSSLLNSSSFQSSLASEISELYSYIINKGFRIYINETLIVPKPLILLWEGLDKLRDRAEASIAPYLYEAHRDDVSVELAVGFYRELPTSAEVEAETRGVRRKSESAGWTVMCNDRVVVIHDKTRLTGWGEAKVPSYHPQFIAIAGVVHFRSKDARKLPVTTTKRGIDASSELYLYVKEWMREGLRTFTSHTNRWKKMPTEERERSQTVKLATPTSIFKDVRSIPSNDSDNSQKIWKNVKTSDFQIERRYVPKLPTPDVSIQSKNRRISFSRPVEDIELVSDYIFEGQNKKPSEVGEACFDSTLKKAIKD